MGILTLLILTPLIGALLAILPFTKNNYAKYIAVITSIIVCILTFLVFVSFDSSDKTQQFQLQENIINCLLYTSPSPRDRTRSRMPSSA